MNAEGAETGFVVILFVTIISWIRYIIWQHKCYKYLRQEHTEKWKELSTVLGIGPGFANGVRGIKFFCGKEDFGDPEIVYLKVKIRNAFIYAATGVGATIITFFIMAYAYCKQ